jgi:DNA repair/transcription protein MET18/MMS19
LDHPTLKNAAALAFDVISNEYPELHLPVVKHLFQQKLFMLVMKTFEKKLGHMTEHHLTAFAFVMKMTPHVVLKMNIAKVTYN